MKTVKEMIDILSGFDPSLPILFRKSEGDGYTSDWSLNTPAVFYPGESVSLSISERFDDSKCEKGN